MDLSRKKIGDLGEKIAQKYLISKNYEILDVNYRTRYGEIDIVGQPENNSVVFFEIKTRTLSQNKFGLPEESVNYFKQKKIAKTAELFLYERGFNPLETNWQFDVLTIIINLTTKTATIKHISDAFSK